LIIFGDALSRRNTQLFLYVGNNKGNILADQSGKCLCQFNFFALLFEAVPFQPAMHIIADDGGRKELAFFTFSSRNHYTSGFRQFFLRTRG
jgi:predicted nucleic acid-binding Zn finger protein